MNKFVSYRQFVGDLCEPDRLMGRLIEQKTKLNPDGWMLIENVAIGSPWYGALSILPYGVNCTCKVVPENGIVMTNGLPSSASTVKYLLRGEDV